MSLVSPTSQSSTSLAPGPHPQHFQQLLGQLAQQENNSLASSQLMESSHTSLPMLGPAVTSTCEILSHRFLSPGRNCDLKNNGATCVRQHHAVSGLVFASHCIEAGDGEDSFEVKIDQVFALFFQTVGKFCFTSKQITIVFVLFFLPKVS